MTPRTLHARTLRRAQAELERVLAQKTSVHLRWMRRRLIEKARRLNTQKLQYATTAPAASYEIESAESLWKIFRQRMETSLREAILSGMVTIASINAAYIAKVTGEALELNSLDLAAAAEKQLANLITHVEESTKREVAKQIVEWYQTPGATLQNAINRLTPPFTESRAETIARTEITRLNSAVQDATANALGITEWDWQTRRDELVCEEELVGPDGRKYAGCRELHGKTFRMGDTMPPGHVRCRCSPRLHVIPRKKPAEEKPTVETPQP